MELPKSYEELLQEARENYLKEPSIDNLIGIMDALISEAQGLTEDHINNLKTWLRSTNEERSLSTSPLASLAIKVKNYIPNAVGFQKSSSEEFRTAYQVFSDAFRTQQEAYISFMSGLE